MIKAFQFFSRAIATALCITFSVTSIGEAAPSISVHSNMTLSALEIPIELATVTDVYNSQSDTSEVDVTDQTQVIFVRDAHDHEQAQRKIEKILRHVQEQTSFKSFFLEGIQNKVDRRYLELFKDRDKTLKAADLLVRLGVLSGAERYLLSKDDISALGVEDITLYDQNLQTLQRVLRGNEFAIQKLREAQYELMKKIELSRNKDWANFFRQWMKSYSEGFEWISKVSYLHEQANEFLGLDLSDIRRQIEWPENVRLGQLLMLESRIDKEALSLEKQSVLEWVSSHDISEGMRVKLQSLLASKSAAKPFSESYRVFFEKAISEFYPLGFELQEYRYFKDWIASLILEEELRFEVLAQEVDVLTLNLLDVLSVSDEEKEMGYIYKDLNMLRRLFELKLSRDEYSFIIANASTFRPEEILGRTSKVLNDSISSIKSNSESLDEFYNYALSFYEDAVKRESYMVDALLSQMKATGERKGVLVVGGFHTLGLKEILKDKKISFVELTPMITDSVDEDLYRNMMLQKTTFNTLESAIPQPRISQGLQKVAVEHGNPWSFFYAAAFNQVIGSISFPNFSRSSLGKGFFANDLTYTSGGLLTFQGAPVQVIGKTDQFIGLDHQGIPQQGKLQEYSTQNIESRSELRARHEIVDGDGEKKESTAEKKKRKRRKRAKTGIRAYGNIVSFFTDIQILNTPLWVWFAMSAFVFGGWLYENKALDEYINERPQVFNLTLDGRIFPDDPKLSHIKFEDFTGKKKLLIGDALEGTVEHPELFATIHEALYEASLRRNEIKGITAQALEVDGNGELILPIKIETRAGSVLSASIPDEVMVVVNADTFTPEQESLLRLSSAISGKDELSNRDLKRDAILWAYRLFLVGIPAFFWMLVQSLRRYSSGSSTRSSSNLPSQSRYQGAEGKEKYRSELRSIVNDFVVDADILWQKASAGVVNKTIYGTFYPQPELFRSELRSKDKNKHRKERKRKEELKKKRLLSKRQAADKRQIDKEARQKQRREIETALPAPLDPLSLSDATPSLMSTEDYGYEPVPEAEMQKAIISLLLKWTDESGDVEDAKARLLRAMADGSIHDLILETLNGLNDRVSQTPQDPLQNLLAQIEGTPGLSLADDDFDHVKTPLEYVLEKAFRVDTPMDNPAMLNFVEVSRRLGSKVYELDEVLSEAKKILNQILKLKAGERLLEIGPGKHGGVAVAAAVMGLDVVVVEPDQSVDGVNAYQELLSLKELVKEVVEVAGGSLTIIKGRFPERDVEEAIGNFVSEYGKIDHIVMTDVIHAAADEESDDGFNETQPERKRLILSKIAALSASSKSIYLSFAVPEEVEMFNKAFTSLYGILESNLVSEQKIDRIEKVISPYSRGVVVGRVYKFLSELETKTTLAKLPYKSLDEDIVELTYEGSRTIDMFFDGEMLKQLEDIDRKHGTRFLERIERFVAQYPRDWQDEDLDGEKPVAEKGVRSLKLKIELPVGEEFLWQGEVFDEIEINGNLFTQENLGEDYRGLRIMHSKVRATDVSDEEIKAYARVLNIEAEGRPVLEAVTYAQKGGNDAQTVKEKFDFSRTELPRRGLRASVAIGYGVYHREQADGTVLEKNGKRLGVFISATCKNRPDRAGRTLNRRMSMIEDTFFADEDREKIAMQALVMKTAKISTMSPLVTYKRVAEKLKINKPYHDYGIYLRQLLDVGLYPYQPHFGNLSFDSDKDLPVIWYDLGGWRIGENLTEEQRIGYFYATLSYGITQVLQDIVDASPEVGLLYSERVFDPVKYFIEGFFAQEIHNPYFDYKKDFFFIASEQNTSFDEWVHSVQLELHSIDAAENPMEQIPLYQRMSAPFIPLIRGIFGLDPEGSDIPNNIRSQASPSSAIRESANIRREKKISRQDLIQAAEKLYEEMKLEFPTPVFRFHVNQDLIEHWLSLAITNPRELDSIFDQFFEQTKERALFEDSYRESVQKIKTRMIEVAISFGVRQETKLGSSVESGGVTEAFLKALQIPLDVDREELKMGWDIKPLEISDYARDILANIEYEIPEGKESYVVFLDKKPMAIMTWDVPVEQWKPEMRTNYLKILKYNRAMFQQYRSKPHFVGFTIHGMEIDETRIGDLATFVARYFDNDGYGSVSPYILRNEKPHDLSTAAVVFPSVYPHSTATSLITRAGIQDYKKGEKVLVIGPGVGAELPVIAKQTGVVVRAVGISPIEIANSKFTVFQQNLEEQIFVGQGDLFDADVISEGEKFDRIVFNVPLTSFDPAKNWWEKATNDPEGKTLERFLSEAKKHLNKEGVLSVTAFEQAPKFQSLLRQYGLKVVGIRDYQDIPDWQNSSQFNRGMIESGNKVFHLQYLDGDEQDYYDGYDDEGFTLFQKNGRRLRIQKDIELVHRNGQLKVKILSVATSHQSFVMQQVVETDSVEPLIQEVSLADYEKFAADFFNRSELRDSLVEETIWDDLSSKPENLDAELKALVEGLVREKTISVEATEPFEFYFKILTTDNLVTLNVYLKRKAVEVNSEYEKLFSGGFYDGLRMGDGLIGAITLKRQQVIDQEVSRNVFRIQEVQASYGYLQFRKAANHVVLDAKEQIRDWPRWIVEAIGRRVHEQFDGAEIYATTPSLIKSMYPGKKDSGHPKIHDGIQKEYYTRPFRSWEKRPVFQNIDGFEDVVLWYLPHADERSELRIIDSDLLAQAQGFGYKHDSLVPLAQIAFEAGALLDSRFDRKLKRELIARFAVEKGLSQEMATDAFNEALQARVDFIQMLQTDLELRQQLGIVTFDLRQNDKNRSTVVYATPGSQAAWQVMAELLIPFFKTEQVSEVPSYAFVGENAVVIQQELTQKQSSLSPEQKRNFIFFKENDSRRIIKEFLSKRKNTLIAAINDDDRSEFAGHAFTTPQPLLKDFTSIEEALDYVESYYYRMLLMQQLSEEITLHRTKAESLKAQLSDSYWIDFIRSFMSRHLPDLKINVTADGHIDLSLGAMQKQLQVFRQAYQALQASA